MDDTSKGAGPPASRPAARHAFRAPRLRTRSTTDNSGTTAEAAVRYPPDTHERTKSESGASSRALDTAARANALFTQCVDIRGICRRQRTHDHVDVRQGREHVKPYDFAKPAFHAIAIHSGVRVLRHDDAGPGVTQKGSDIANLEMCGSESLPLQADCLECAFPREPRGSREAAAVRSLRTSTGV